MTKINFSNLPNQNNQQNDKPRIFRPGVHKVTITGVTESPQDMVGTPYVQVGYVNNETNSYINDKMYVTEKAMPYTADKLKNIVKEACGTELEGELTVDVLNGMLTNKTGYLKVSGEEKMIDDRDNPGQQVKIVNSVLDGFKYFVSEDNKVNLNFNDLTDIKRLPVAETSTQQPVAASDDMPF